MKQKIELSFHKLKSYCEKENYSGWDPYDGLNSQVFKFLNLNKITFFRLAWIQLFKRNPLNLRNLLLVSKEYNPKGLGLFLTGYCNLYKQHPEKHYLDTIVFLADELLDLKTEGYSGACWGYNFDWQSRAFFLPKQTPTVVATSFIASSLLDAFDITGDKRYLEVAISSADFILNDLNRTVKDEGFIFSYSPYDNTCVYNASLLGSKILARIFTYNKDQKLIEKAKQSVQACVAAQAEDGSWVYGEMEIQNWVDSFHTGYNLECIQAYQEFSGDKSFGNSISIGVEYYLNNFFLSDGTPKYYDKEVYPIDIHAPAQFVVTLYKLDLFEKNKKLIDKVLNWTIDNMQENKGYFFYQKKPYFSSKIPYMRWAQAWMFYAYSFYFMGAKNVK